MASERIELVSATGALDLTTWANYGVARGRRATLMPPMRLSAERAAGQPGERLRQIVPGARTIDLPLVAMGADADALEALLDTLPRYLAPLEQITLRRTRRDGSQRDLSCYYQGGLEDATQTGGSLRVVLSFWAGDPFWYARNAVSISWGLAAVTSGWFPFFPLKLWTSGFFGSPVINNAGDVEAWPLWTITGPGSNLALRNLTTGKALVLTTTLLAGQTLLVDTRPYYGTITHSADGRLPIPSGSELWSLAKGSNSLRIEVTGADANSLVQLSYYPRYWSA